MDMDLNAFASAYRASFNAQTAMFPGMVHPTGVIAGPPLEGVPEGRGSQDPQYPSIMDYIDKYSAMPDVLAWKMPGAGGGGYLACVVADVDTFTQKHPESIQLTIRRN